MGQALLGIGAGAAGAFGGAYDAARQNRIRGDLGDLELQSAKRDAAALSAIGQSMPALQGVGMPPGMPPQQPQGGPPGMPPGMPPQPQGGPPSGAMPPPQQGSQRPPPQAIAPFNDRFQGMPQGGAQVFRPGIPMQGGMPRPPQPPMLPQGGPPQGMPQRPPGPPPQGMPQQGQQPPQMGVRWQQVAQTIAQANPGIKPDVLTQAVNMFMTRFGTPQNQMEWKEQQLQVKQQQQEARAQQLQQHELTLRAIAGDKNATAILLRQMQGESALDLEGLKQTGRTEMEGKKQEGRIELEGKKDEAKSARQKTAQDFKAEQAQFKRDFDSGQLDKRLAQQDKNNAARIARGEASSMSPQDIRDYAAGIATYNLAPTTGRDKAKIMAEVLRINPSYNQTQWTGANASMRNFLAGPEGRAIRYITVARGHMDKLQELAKGLKNYDTKVLNKLKNEYDLQLGEDAQSNFQIAASAVGSEIVKAIIAAGNAGAGSMHERQAMAERLSMNLGSKQFDGAFKTLNDLIDQQVGGLKQQYEASGNKDFEQRWPRLKVEVTADKSKLPPGYGVPKEK